MFEQVFAALTKTPRALTGAIAGGACATIAWTLLDAPTAEGVLLPFIFIGASAGAFCAFSTAIHFWQKAENMRSLRVVPFEQLSAEQCDHLQRVFQSGRRDFDVPLSSTDANWLIRLIELNYVAFSGTTMRAATYRITQGGWAAIEAAQAVE